MKIISATCNVPDGSESKGIMSDIVTQGTAAIGFPRPGIGCRTRGRRAVHHWALAALAKWGSQLSG